MGERERERERETRERDGAPQRWLWCGRGEGPPPFGNDGVRIPSLPLPLHPQVVLVVTWRTFLSSTPFREVDASLVRGVWVRGRPAWAECHEGMREGMSGRN